MADNTVKIHFKPDGDESLVRAIKALDKETKNLLNTQAKIIDNNNQNTRSNKRQSDSMRRLFIQLKANDKSFKDLGLSTDVLTKAFKGNKIAIEKARIAMRKLKQEQEKADVTTRILGGTFAVLRSKLLLVGFAVGTIARPILNIVNLSTRLESVSQAFDTLSGGTTQSSIAMDKLKKATDNTMSGFDLFKQANNAMILGVTKNSDEMAEMFDIAQRLGKALGRDTASSVESLITGIGRQSRLMLDNIGIIVKSEEAYEKYAKSINKTASNLTDSEKKQAFFNATMESARAKVNSLGDESLTTQDVFAQLGVSFEEAGVSIGTTLTPAILTMSEALRAGAVTAKGFFDMINSIFGLGEKAEELPINTQISILKANLNSLIDRGLVDVNSSMSLFGNTMGALPFNESIFSLSELGMQSALTSEQLNNIVSEIQRLSNLQDVQFQTTAKPFDIDTNKKASEELKKLKDDEERHEKNRVQMAKKVAEELKTIAKEIADEEKRLQKEKESVRKAVLGQTTEFQLQELKKLESVFLKHHASTLESEQFFSDARKEILAKENEERKEISKKRMDMEIQTAGMILGSIKSVTSEIESLTNQRVQNDLQALKQTEVFQDASAEKRQNLENQVLAKHSKTQFAMFMVNKAVKLADIAMATASGIATVSALPPLFMANPMIPFLKAMGLAQAGIVMATPPPPTFETGGLVGGRRHSQGGTLIEAERGEFVMSRNAVQSLGVETMNQINQGNAGGITLNISAPLVDETILDTIIPAIEKAQRNNLA